MRRYNFYEFSGFQLIEKLQQNGYKPIDFSTRTQKSLAGVIKSVGSRYDNAMFCQVRQCLQALKETAGYSSTVSDGDEDSLKSVLIYIDFSEVFPAENFSRLKFHWSGKQELTDEEEAERRLQIKECENIVEVFFKTGFEIRYPEQVGNIRYVPFEKSASMARASSMLFIDERLYKAMEKRLRLGFDFSAAKVSASKLYAYTGLYLSDGKRIRETRDFVLNEETVIVLSDNVSRNKNNGNKEISVPIEVISGDEAGVTELDGFQKWPVKRFGIEEFKTTVNYFDGEGLISPSYCAEINRVLNTDYGVSGTAASFQIRMPFTKGMLHHVDFHKFICETLGMESCEDVWIIDAHGHRRSLEKAQIILTQSMFKMDKWLTNPKISSVGENDDPMALYFNRFHEYGHAFYVGITDMNLSQAGKTKLNYQFFNTLALTQKEFDEITDEQVGLATTDKAKELLRDISSDNINEEGDASFDDVAVESDTWCAAAARNPAFINDPKVKGMLKGVRYSLLKDVGRGRLTVKGSTKFLSRDLLALLLFMIGRIESGDTVSDEQKQLARSRIRKEQLWTTRFFSADCVPGNPAFSRADRKLHLRSKTYYGLLRNPHLSRNEQCSLSPFIPRRDGIYSRYFGHLKGILMVPQFSYVPQALGGADFDGDMVKLITDERINRAINDACYRPDEAESDSKHERKLPVVMIPDTSPRTVLLPENGVDFRTLVDTFSSRVGEISNHAIYLGKREYDDEHPDPSYDLKCETCTIYAGLEIDAAKTGRHPYLADLFADRKKDYFVARKEEIDELPEQYAFEVKEYPETKNTVGRVLPHRLSAVMQYGPATGEELMIGVITGDYDGYYPIDRLPQRCLQELSVYRDPGFADQKDTGFRFAFEENADWKKQLSDPEKTDLVRELIYSYRKILDTARNVYRIEERLKKSNYVGCINTILRTQHKGLLKESQLMNLQEKVFSHLLSQFDTYEKAEAALKKLVGDRRWQFCESDEAKKDYIENRIFADSSMRLDAEVQKVLFNFRWSGYYLLYYYIKDIMLFYREAETDLRLAQGEQESTLATHAAGFYDEFREIYERALSEKEPQSIWKKKIIERCRNVLRESFSDRADIALRYVHKLRNCDQYGTFFWDVFTANEILQESEVLSRAE